MIRLACIACLLVAPIATEAQTLAVKDSTGVVVGFYEGPAGAPGRIRVISSTGYSAVYLHATGAQDDSDVGEAADGGQIKRNVNYTSEDCSGQGFAVAESGVSESSIPSGLFPMPGTVFRTGSDFGSHVLMYVPKGAAPVGRSTIAAQFRSYSDSGRCVVGTQVSQQSLLFPAFPNDSAVTGFPDVPLAPPLTIEPVPVSAVFSIFRDSFESTQANRRAETIATTA